MFRSGKRVVAFDQDVRYLLSLRFFMIFYLLIVFIATGMGARILFYEAKNDSKSIRGVVHCWSLYLYILSTRWTVLYASPNVLTFLMLRQTAGVKDKRKQLDWFDSSISTTAYAAKFSVTSTPTSTMSLLSDYHLHWVVTIMSDPAEDCRHRFGPKRSMTGEMDIRFPCRRTGFCWRY